MCLTTESSNLKIKYKNVCISVPFCWSVKWAAPCENLSSGICGQRRSRSVCASAQSDQGFYYPLTESLDTAESMNGENIPVKTLGIRKIICLFGFLRMFEGTFFLDAT